MELKISQRQLHECIYQTLFYIPCQLPWQLQYWLLSRIEWHPYKRNTTQLGLLLFENKVNNNSQTWPLINLTSLGTFYSWSELSLRKNNNIINMKNEQNGKFQFWVHILLPFYLILTRAPIIIVKNYLRVILSWRMLFKVAFRCRLY